MNLAIVLPCTNIMERAIVQSGHSMYAFQMFYGPCVRIEQELNEMKIGEVFRIDCLTTLHSSLLYG